MRGAGWVLLFVAVAGGAGAEVSISTGGTGELVAPGAEAGAELFAAAGASLLQPLGSNSSLLVDSAAEVAWRPWESTVTGSGSIAGQVGLQVGALLGRLRIGARGRGTIGPDPMAAPVASAELSAAVPLSWEGEAASVGVEPEARIYAGDRLRWSTGIEASVEAMVADSLIVSASAFADVELPVDAFPEPGFSLEVALEWLTGIPLALSASAAFERRLSTNVEILDVDGVAVEVPGYWGYLLVRGDARASAVLGRRANLLAELAVGYRAGDHGVLLGATLLPEKDWSLDIAPSVEVGISISRNVELAAALADTLTLSEAGTVNTISLSLEARLTFP